MSSASTKSPREELGGALIREDLQLVGLLALLAVAAVLGVTLLTLLPLSYRAVYFIVGIYAIHLPVLGIGFMRMTRKHYSAPAGLWFLIAVLVWALWNQLIWWVSVLSGWWATGQPVYHLAISGAIGLLPLLAVIWRLGTRLRTDW
jgi:uncharacterized membrane protein YuzA (DUF378 family)